MNTENQCKKTSFGDSEAAQKRLKEINETIKAGEKKLMRVYKCSDCGNYHLTSMTKHKFNNTKTTEARMQFRRKVFLEMETDFWNRKFKINAE